MVMKNGTMKEWKNEIKSINANENTRERDRNYKWLRYNEKYEQATILKMKEQLW